MTDSSPAEKFAAALRELYEAADSPTYALLVHQASQQRPPIKFTETSLSDWLRGVSVPANPAAVHFLAAYLGGIAKQRGRPVQGRDWTALHERAWKAKQASRGGRPFTGDRNAARRGVPAARLGRPVSDCDPLALEVHPAIDIPGQRSAGRLPAYVPRVHDQRLREIANDALAGTSRWVTLVGGSSTGKTRACWELAQHLDAQQPGRWWLWHPYDPTRPEAAAAAIDRAGPYTIVWLNEAQFYLAPADVRLGERIAAGLRTLLQDPDRGPVLVLATLWPQHWSALTTRPAAGEPDPYAQARDLLAGTAITVADVFTPGELAGLDGAGVDARLRQAAAHAEGGRIIQYLAGAPELEDRYRTAPPPARAIIRVAMDARRLGHPLALPHALLAQAAPGYLDDHDWDTLGEDWLEQALAYTAHPCKGARGPLTRIRTRPGDPPGRDGQPCYRLADYLEQTSRGERAGIFPPESLWTAFVTTVTDPGLLRQLGQQAERRGRYQHAIWLYIGAAGRGDTRALRGLAGLRERAGDAAGAEALAVQAADRGDTGALWSLALGREEAGDAAGAEALAVQAADRGDTDALRDLARRREQAEDHASAVRMRRFGLTGGGEVVTTFDSGSYGGLAPE